MNIERDKFLTEQMGCCWHEWMELYHDSCADYSDFECVKCKDWVSIPDASIRQGCLPYNTSFSTWEGFGLLFTWAQEQKWYAKFVFDRLRSGYACYPTSRMNIPDRFIHPDHFADAIYGYLKERKR